MLVCRSVYEISRARHGPRTNFNKFNLLRIARTTTSIIILVGPHLFRMVQELVGPLSKI